MKGSRELAGILTRRPVLYCDTDQPLNYTDTEKRIKCKIIFGKYQIILRQILLQIQINLAVTKQIFRPMQIEKAKQSKVPPCFQKGKKSATLFEDLSSNVDGRCFESRQFSRLQKCKISDLLKQGNYAKPGILNVPLA